MEAEHLLRGVAQDIERWAEDSLALMAHELEAEAAAWPGDEIALACSCGVKWMGRIQHEAAQTLTRNWHVVHCGPGHQLVG